MKTRLATLLLVVLALTGCNRMASDYSWEEDLAYRESVDYTWTPEQVKEYIQKYIPDVTDEQIAYWTENGPLESKMIDGQLRYYRRTAAGLFLVDSTCMKLKWEFLHPDGEQPGMTRHDTLECANMMDIINQVKETGNPLAAPAHMKVKFTLTVDADAVPAGETIRCWLPFPRKDVTRQQDVKFISCNRTGYKFSNPKCPHSSLYMEAEAVAGEPTVFSEEFEYTIFGEWHKIDPEMVKPYDTSSAVYKKYTAEREKHIVFSDRMKNLADSLTAGIDNPFLQAKAIFEWIDKIPWSGAREYSTLANIPEFVLDTGHGDCGQVTLLFCTLCRIKGIPTHFQSGHVVDPDGDGMHDWSEIYFEGIGWVPMDMSFGIRTYASNDDEKYFFLGGNDTYRLIINQDYGYELSPKKIYPRSDDVDFQRGEVEWKGGNIYFPQWDYDLEIEYLD